MKNQQNIIFSVASASHKNGTAERAIKMVITMVSTMLITTALRCPEGTLSTDICLTMINYYIRINNQIPVMNYGLSYIEIWSRSRFEPVSETLSICHVWFLSNICFGTKVSEA